MKLLKSVKGSIVAAGGAVSLFASKALADSVDTANTYVNTLQTEANAGSTNLNDFLGNIINVLIGVVGIAAVIMLIIGGFRYVFSQGDEKGVKGAKDTILYAIIGIVVAVLAFAIVNFVLGGLNG